jgi:hypothetical protein
MFPVASWLLEIVVLKYCVDELDNCRPGGIQLFYVQVNRHGTYRKMTEMEMEGQIFNKLGQVSLYEGVTHFLGGCGCPLCLIRSLTSRTSQAQA